MKNADVSLVGTGIAWETSSATQLIRTNMFRCLRWPVLTGDRYVRGNDESSFNHRNEYTITTLVSIPKWLCVGRITSLPMTFLSSLTGPYGVVLNKDEDGNITFLDPPEEER